MLLMYNVKVGFLTMEVGLLIIFDFNLLTEAPMRLGHMMLQFT